MLREEITGETAAIQVEEKAKIQQIDIIKYPRKFPLYGL